MSKHFLEIEHIQGEAYRAIIFEIESDRFDEPQYCVEDIIETEGLRNLRYNLNHRDKSYKLDWTSARTNGKDITHRQMFNIASRAYK
jgi:hypothetical protein